MYPVAPRRGHETGHAAHGKAVERAHEDSRARRRVEAEIHTASGRGPDEVDEIGSIGGKTIRGAQLQRQLESCWVGIDGHDALGADEPCGHHRAEPYSANSK